MGFKAIGSVQPLRSWVLAAAGVSLLLAGCQQKNEYVAPPPPQVTVSKAVVRPVTDYAEFTGTTEAVESVEIRARVEGYLEKIHFKPGSLVKEGQVLFTIDPKPYLAKLDEARAELERRKAELKQADATLKRKEMALKANAVSELEVLQGRADRDVAQAAIEGAQAAIDTAQLNVSYTRVPAPIGGRIGRNLVDVGNLVGASENTLLTTIVKDDPVYAYFTVSERDLLQGQKYRLSRQSPTNGDGQTVLSMGLSTETGYPFEGRIDFVDNRLDPSTGTIQVRGIFANGEHRLWPGLFVRIRVPIHTNDQGLLVPDTALGTDQRGQYLLLVNAQNVVEYRPVKAGALLESLREIREGISLQDRVIVSGIQSARPGITVAPTEAGDVPTAVPSQSSAQAQ